MRLGEHLRARRDAGRKLLIPYLCGGLGDDWIECVWAAIDAGADAVEIGIPFSDPMIDGPVIQRASQLALEGGATPIGILGEIGRAEFAVPIAVMTYYNLLHHAGLERFAGWMADAHVQGGIFPDLSLEESGPWRKAAEARGLETVQLVAPSTSTERAERICEAAEGFIYGVGVMGVTGERATLASSATEIGKRLKAITDKPVLIGIGVSTPSQAYEASQSADGVVVGSAVVRRVLDGEGPKGVGAFVGELRRAIDAD